MLSTISAHVRLLPGGFESRTRQATDGTVFVVCEGTGELLLGEEVIDLKPRDVFVIPSWVPHRFRAASELVLFAYSDKASQVKLDLYREFNH